MNAKDIAELANHTYCMAWYITATCLYSTGHLIGGCVALIMGTWVLI
jgi:hypothetical protein